jgi:hypothetical protein
VVPLRPGHPGRGGEPDETAFDSQDPRGLLDGDAKQLVEIELRPHLGREAGDEALSLQRVLGRGLLRLRRRRRRSLPAAEG